MYGGNEGQASMYGPTTMYGESQAQPPTMFGPPTGSPQEYQPTYGPITGSTPQQANQPTYGTTAAAGPQQGYPPTYGPAMGHRFGPGPGHAAITNPRMFFTHFRAGQKRRAKFVLMVGILIGVISIVFYIVNPQGDCKGRDCVSKIFMTRGIASLSAALVFWSIGTLLFMRCQAKSLVRMTQPNGVVGDQMDYGQPNVQPGQAMQTPAPPPGDYREY